MRKAFRLIASLWFCGVFAAAADTFQLTDGTSVTGSVISYTDNGLILRQADDSYSDRMPWLKFSQDSLKQLAKNPKVAPFAEPFIDPAPTAAIVKKDINVSEPTRLGFLPSQSLFGALFGSPVLLLGFLLIYAANLFAAYEVAIFRRKPAAAVIGTSAVLPVLGPIIFLSMAPEPVVEEPTPAEVAAAAAPPEPHHFTVPQVSPVGEPTPTPAPMARSAPPSVSAPKEEIHIIASGFSGEPPPPSAEFTVETFQRGQFMFNRRFFETKFAGFFGIVRTEADRGKVMTVKIPATLLTVERIARLGANEIYFDVMQGGQRQEMMVPFADIQQIQLKSKA
ncbi:MAG TPA: hypothetical protein VGN23_09070 [Verrucomicrobiae bacterium]|jgi:hypothetical protein